MNNKAIQYADDTTIIVAHKDISVLCNTLNSILKNIETYCLTNKIVINKYKSKAMFFKCERAMSFKFLSSHLVVAVLNLLNTLNSLVFILVMTSTLYIINHVIGKLNSANHVLIKSRLSYVKMLFEAIGMSHINFVSIIYLHLCKQRYFHHLSSRYIDCGKTIAISLLVNTAHIYIIPNGCLYFKYA